MKEKSNILSDIENAVHKFIAEYGVAPNTCFLTEKTLKGVLADYLNSRLPNFQTIKDTEIKTIYGLNIKKGNIDCVSLVEEI